MHHAIRMSINKRKKVLIKFKIFLVELTIVLLTADLPKFKIHKCIIIVFK